MNRNESFVPVPLLRQLISLDHETGNLTWLPRIAGLFPAGSRSPQHAAALWNSRYAGTPALASEDQCGHLCGRIFNRMIYAHRAVYALVSGSWPAHTIDHINGKPSDNRPVNLRDVPHIENHKNQATRKNNTSGVMGVSMNKRLRKWAAHITVAGQDHHLGFHDDKADAIAARKAAESRFNFHPNHGRRA